MKTKLYTVLTVALLSITVLSTVQGAGASEGDAYAGPAGVGAGAARSTANVNENLRDGAFKLFLETRAGMLTRKELAAFALTHKMRGVTRTIVDLPERASDRVRSNVVVFGDDPITMGASNFFSQARIYHGVFQAACSELQHLTLRGSLNPEQRYGLTTEPIHPENLLFLQYARKLKTLKLESSKIGTLGTIVVAAARGSVPNLRYLELGHNDIGDDGVKALAAALPSMEKLEMLDLTH